LPGETEENYGQFQPIIYSRNKAEVGPSYHEAAVLPRRNPCPYAIAG